MGKLIERKNMPDISMCSNDDCPVNKDCYRYTAPPNEYWQSYSDFKYQDNTCSGFITILKKENK